ncbi:MAG: glycerate kinase type-2 family protein, partial [Candidatus Aminicenantaceae bacterium]
MNSKKTPYSLLFEEANQIYSEALRAVSPEKLIADGIEMKGNILAIKGKNFDLSLYKNIYVIAFGKSAPYMAKSLFKIIGQSINKSIVLSLPKISVSLPDATVIPASHPVPDKGSLEAAKRILMLVQNAGKEDLVIHLISGGGSAQLCFPSGGISLEDKVGVTDKLLKAGASIYEMNVVRKHISRIKGGRLAQAAFPATVMNIIISDVVGNDLGTIASGPVHWDLSTHRDAFKVLEKYCLWDKISESVRKVIDKGIKGEFIETLKKDSFLFKNIHNFIIGDNRLALNKASRKAEELGFKTVILTTSEQKEARDSARYYSALLGDILLSGKTFPQPLCLLGGGELTVTVKGKGKGGRNQEFVLACLAELQNEIKEQPGWLILSLGTDGIDGNTDAAGAWIDCFCWKKSKRLLLDPHEFLYNNDSYHFFEQTGHLIKTGLTHTNVM